MLFWLSCHRKQENLQILQELIENACDLGDALLLTSPEKNKKNWIIIFYEIFLNSIYILELKPDMELAFFFFHYEHVNYQTPDITLCIPNYHTEKKHQFSIQKKYIPSNTINYAN